MGLTVYGGGGKPEEEKTVTAGTSVIEVLPSSGKTMKKVTINPAPFPTGLILTSPTKTSYNAGENLDLTGLTVKAKFSDGTEQDVTSECTFSPSNGTVLYEDTSEVIVSWSYSGAATYTTKQPITVKRVLSSIAITKNPNKTTYYSGESLSLSGLKVMATFTSGATEEVTSLCTSNPASGTLLTTTGSKVVTISYTENSITKTASFTIKISVPIYGVEWDGTSSTKFSRTDAAELFTDPVPYVNGASSFGSPFDNIFPWSDMQIVDDATAGKLVKIPKYYFKWTKSGTKMQLQISEAAFDGSYVSPAHADRGDGKGERDVVYVGRYHCNSSYKSVSGQTPVTSITRATARTNIHNLGSPYWQYDFAMYWTIAMLYLVEFADWNSQAEIGYGCSPSGSKWNVGYTDSMPYHTGTTASARTSYGGTQYRHIEGLWDNVFDWCDGIYFSGANVYCIKNPASFSDSSGGTLVGTRPTSSGWISAFNVPTANGFEYALHTSATSGSENTYITDHCSSGGVVFYVGGSSYHDQGCGLFYFGGGNSASGKGSGVGSRLQKLS